MKKLVHGVGVNDKHGVDERVYALWRGVLVRSNNIYEELNPTYIGVSCCKRWIKLSNFVSDISDLHGFDNWLNQGWQLDKDILVKGNKSYEKDMVCFVPKDVNNLFIKRGALRGDFPIGVSYHKPLNKFRAQINIDKTKKHIGIFDDVNQAFCAYKIEKEKHIKLVAERWKGIISDNVYNAMIAYEVNIND